MMHDRFHHLQMQVKSLHRVIAAVSLRPRHCKGQTPWLDCTTHSPCLRASCTKAMHIRMPVHIPELTVENMTPARCTASVRFYTTSTAVTRSW
jgi:hypothetical protein